LNQKPLKGLLVLDFSQFLSGPYAGLRLADLGARVIKIERYDGGDICRQLYISNLALDGDSTLFHSINRNKESYAANLKQESDRSKLRELLRQADVMIQNFRPGVIEKLGFGYESVKTINPRLVYGSISGYGSEGPYRTKPGQDLLVQSIAGVPWLSHEGLQGKKPIPFGLAIADMMTGAHLVQGILAALHRRSTRGMGGLVEVSLLESTLDVLQEEWETKLNGSVHRREHAEAALPAGLYRTEDGYIALLSTSLAAVAAVLAGENRTDRAGETTQVTIEDCLLQKPAAYWAIRFRQAGIPCEELRDWRQLLQHEAFRVLDMTQEVARENGAKLSALSCPIRLNGIRPRDSRGAPQVGEHNAAIETEWGLAD
jgi:CoA:oxalate CoA-transferase